ncbi:MAG: hypothetical protein K2K31_01275, partial [Clostridia bacterium]|nr:hypothetical protein [Clostridia bacterium]
SNILLRQKIDDKNFLDEKQKFIRKLLVGNSSLLLLDLKKLNAIEWFILNDMKDFTTVKEYEAARELIREPKYLCMMNDLTYGFLYSYAESNIKNLRKIVGEERTARYIKDNPYFMAMNEKDFSSLLNEIVAMDKQSGDNHYMEKFLFMGKSLFGGDYRFKVEDITKKLRDDKCRKRIEIDLKSDEQCFKKFLKLFVSDKDKQIELFEKVNKLNEFAQRFKTKSDVIREDVEYAGILLKLMSRTMNTDNADYEDQTKEYIQSLSEHISKVTDSLISVYGASTFDEARKVEEKIFKSVNEIFKEVSDIYQEKNSKICKLYSGVGAMYERASKYLAEILIDFSSNQPLVKLFDEKVKGEYFNQIKNLFNVQQTGQQRLLGQQYDVKVD